MKCPRCDAEVTGRFCGYCGGALQREHCHACRAEVPPGYRYCSECGAEQALATPPAPSPGEGLAPGSPPPATGQPTRAGGTAPPPLPLAAPAPATSDATAGPSHRAWWIGGGAAVVALALLALPYLWSPWPAGIGGERIPMGGTPGIGAGMAPNVDLSAMTPREAADRLFNRVMAALSAGDVAEVEAFLPMALDAYRMVPALDADGYFHYSLLQQAAGDYDGGLESAQIVLQTQPDHLLALYAAGEAARDLGELELARTYFQRLLEVYPEESVRPLPEYQEHGGFLPTIQETAREFLALGGA